MSTETLVTPELPTMQARMSRLVNNGPVALAPMHFGTVARVDPRTERAVALRAGNVAIVQVRGSIIPREDRYSAFFGEVGAEDTARRVIEALNDNAVKSVVMAFDSGGGNIQGVSEAVAAIRAAKAALKVKKPIIAHADFVMASAAYWLATAADEIVANPSAQIGAVGVISMSEDLTGMLELAGIKVHGFAKPADKLDGWPYWPMTEKGAERRQAAVDQIYNTFVADIVAARNVDKSAILEEWAGVYNAPQAKLQGMIDKVRSLPETLAVYSTTGTPFARLKAANRMAILKGK